MRETYETVYVVYTCSDDDQAALSVGVSSGHAARADVRGDESLIESVCVWVVNVVVDTGVVVEAGWLPELLHVGVRVVVVQQEH